MRKPNMILLFGTVILAIATIIGATLFLKNQVGEINLTEETLVGNVEAAEGLQVGFRADGGEKLHWISDFDFSTKTTKSSFKRGDMAKADEYSVYDDFQFTTRSTLPYTILLKDEKLGGLQEKDIQKFYDEIQKQAVQEQSVIAGKVRVKDYLDYYPVGFKFRFGTKIYNSDDALEGLKILNEHKSKSDDKAATYDADVKLYREMNQYFQIPVIENEYQEYEASEDSLKVEITQGTGEDFYQFDPIIVLQEENLLDGKTWQHPDLVNLKNRILFIVNNRTEKGEVVDFSQVKGGYGLYELPIEAGATATVRYGNRSMTVPNPKPLGEELSMVYALDEDVEYVEMSMSDDHRYLAVFSIEEGLYYVELIDADTWESQGRFEMFNESKKISYAWGEDGSLVATNHKDEIAVICRTGEVRQSHRLLYRGKIPESFDNVFFSNAYGLAIAEKDGKIAFSQNPLIEDESSDMREPSLECAIIDKTGLIYWGKLHSNVMDLEAGEEQDLGAGKKNEELLSKMIVPVMTENRINWI